MIQKVISFCDAHEGLAAWTQALFSVAAILAAIAIDRGTTRRAMREHRERQAQATAVRQASIQSAIEACRTGADRIVQIANDIQAGVDIETIATDPVTGTMKPHPYEAARHAWLVLLAYTQGNLELEISIVSQTIQAETDLKIMIDRLDEIGSPYDPQNFVAAISAFNVTAGRLEKVLAPKTPGNDTKRFLGFFRAFHRRSPVSRDSQKQSSR